MGAIILAAGSSSRLGQPKQLVLLEGETLLARALGSASEAGCEPIVVVLGACAAEMQAQSSLTSARIVVNGGWEEGMASSIRAGVESIAREVNGAILMTCDQPAVTADHLRSLMVRDPSSKIASAYGERRGVPAYFPAGDFPDLLRLRGAQGARELLAEAESIELAGGELDIDTPEQLALARARYKRQHG